MLRRPDGRSPRPEGVSDSTIAITLGMDSHVGPTLHDKTAEIVVIWYVLLESINMVDTVQA